MLRLESDIQERTRAHIDQDQRDYYLREQLKVIQAELRGDTPYGYEEGDEDGLYDDDDVDEINEYAEKIRAATEGAAPEIRADTSRQLQR